MLSGNEDKYRAGGGGSTNTASVTSLNGNSPLKTTRSGTGPWLGQQVDFLIDFKEVLFCFFIFRIQVSSGSHHLESVPCSTPIAHARGHMKIRDYAHSPDDLEMYKRILENASQPEDLVPIR